MAWRGWFHGRIALPVFSVQYSVGGTNIICKWLRMGAITRGLLRIGQTKGTFHRGRHGKENCSTRQPDQTRERRIAIKGHKEHGPSLRRSRIRKAAL